MKIRIEITDIPRVLEFQGARKPREYIYLDEEFLIKLLELQEKDERQSTDNN